ncbi:DUF6283 family protein [Amycolatopsis sp. NPDC004625]|uniref:DUF6283 family protein n=1 Tax=Amycolatopsis sp. NPDC004625 TaxID=3154670 RepID=UPI0033A64DDB
MSNTPDDTMEPTPTDVHVVLVRPGADGWGVVTLEAPAGNAYQEKPCPTCPWLLESRVGAFPPEVFRLSAHTTYDQGTRRFGCHASRPDEPLTCAGFLLRGAAHNLAVRMHGPDIATAVSSDRPLYDNYRAMAIANGVDPDDPVLAPCRDSRPYLHADVMTSSSGSEAIAADQSATAVSRAAGIIRDFMVASVGMDLGAAMLDDAALLAGRLAAAGHLHVRGHDHHPGDQSALEVIRAFVVECHSEDTGTDATDLAEDLHRALAAGGVLDDGVFEPIPYVGEQA